MAPWLPLVAGAAGFPARRRCPEAAVVVTHALVQSGSCSFSFGFVFDEVAVQRELADQRIDLAQAPAASVGAAPDSGAQSVIADARFQGDGAGLLDAGGPYFLANDSTP